MGLGKSKIEVPRMFETQKLYNIMIALSLSLNLQITSKLLTQGYRYHKLRKTFWKFLRSYYELLSKNCSKLKSPE